MKKSIFLLVPVIWCLSFHDQIAAGSKIETEILNILEKQKTAWNNQDLEGFMAYYWKSDEFIFQSGNIRLRGWQALLERYKKNYSGEDWGKLDFTDLDIKSITENCVYVLGRWKVSTAEASKEGLFTIILKRFPQGWRIIHDHTS
jgi:beta-aspartyl-peptidase (threonine type)